ncbi:MAG: hypothetical protein IH991_02500 [Planctomycetes bacterium]|nr:hypothetical protein [Planctomycetota bacterium]
MAANKKTWVKLQLTGEGVRDDIDAKAFIEVFQTTIEALTAINRESSRHGSENISWRVIDAGHSSPLYMTITGVDPLSRNGDDAADVIEAFVDGLQHLEQSNTCPRRFNERALKCATELVRPFAKGITSIEFTTHKKTARATHEVSRNAHHAISVIEHAKAKQSGQYVDFGTIEGRLDSLETQERRDKVRIVDDLTGVKTLCYFRNDELEEKARKAWKHRVSISGEITIDRYTGDAIKLEVDDIRILRDRKDLPQIEDLGIDITDGVESSEYVRDLRDAE